MESSFEAVALAVSILAVFGIGMTMLNFLAGRGAHWARPWVEDRSPLVYGGVLVIFFAFMVAFGRIDPFQLLVIPHPGTFTAMLLLAPLVALTFYFFELYLASKQTIAPAGMLASSSARDATENMIKQPPVWWGLAVASAIVEEYIFRGMLLSALTADFNIVVGIAVSALIFGLHHITFGVVSVVSKSLGGVLFGIQVAVCGSLIPAMVSHLLFQYLVWRRMKRKEAGV